MANDSGVTWRRGMLAKFALAFAALLISAAGLGLYAIERLDDVQAAAETISGHWLQTTRALGDISYLGQRFRVIEAAVILAPPQQVAAEEKTLGEIRADVAAAFAREAKLVQSPEEKAEFAAIRTAWAAYLALDDRFLAAATAPGDAAAALYRSAMRDSIHDLQGALKTAIKHNVEQADAAARLSREIGSDAARDLVIGFAFVAAICIVVGWRLVGAIVRPIRALTVAMSRLAEGATDTEVPGLARADEIGAMARASQVFKNASRDRGAALQREADTQRAAADEVRDAAALERERVARAQGQAMRALGAALRALAEGDLERGLEAGFPTEFSSLSDDFELARAKLASALSAVIGASAALARECRELGDGADDLSSRSERQAAALEQSSAALQQITATVKESSAGAADARAAVAAADGEAKRSAGVVAEAVKAMAGLSQSAREIREITGLIDEIAFQTNLLALNAGVEAARAGDAGRGFAVVATEVRALAQRSADMAKRIAELISTSDRLVASGVAKVGATGEALTRIAAGIGRLNAIVDSIATAAVEQARGLQEINGAVQEMDQVTQRNAAMAGQTSESTRRLGEEVERLDRLMRQFRVGEPPAGRRAA